MKKGPAYLLALASGVLTAAAFPKFNLAFFAWISLIPLLYALAKSPPRRAFGLGLAAGVVFYGVLVYWIPDVPAHYGGMSYILSLLIYLAMILFLGLFWAVFAMVLRTAHRAFPAAAWLAAPLFWVGFEYAVTHVFTGFPWGILGASQFRNTPLIQAATLAGAYGISFLLVFLQATFVLAVTRRLKEPFFAALGLLALAHGWGAYAIKRTSTELLAAAAGSFPTAVIQGNVSSDIYWDAVSPEEVWRLFDEHMALTERAYDGGARLIIWPEFTVPLCFSCPGEPYEPMKAALQDYVRRSGATLLIGTNEQAGPPEERRYFNTAMCLQPDLRETRYAKMHLVPFGEYTPYKKIFSFIEKLTHAIGDITPGTEHVLHDYEGRRFGSPICYEIIFPALVREFTRRGADFLVTITNDGWYGPTSAPHQHFAQAVLRAVENRRFLLRAATTGISGVVDPCGRVLAESEIMTQTFLLGRIIPRRSLTPYVRFGDVLPVAGLTTAGLFLILALVRRKRSPER